MGLVDAICSAEEDAEAIIKEKTNGNGLDAVFEASGAGVVFNQAIALLKERRTYGIGRKTDQVSGNHQPDL